ncbi:MAG TPA: NAD(P)/FAD-dependent oxidoreductase [Rariglobus sp.]|jgi:flavin-dependent dehydrogenase|nr:NAD(P)/FAD-dependent oxidoreductase [Rariglobus sp.]
MKDQASSEPWDVIIIGGALSGASTACLLLRRDPRLRVLILERSEQFKRRVGESTVEISSYFLGRVLDLTGHLQEKHLVKQGLRFWFKNDRTAGLDQCSETGPVYNVRLPGYQVDRAVLDEEVLTRAIAAGAVLKRPVDVRTVELQEGGLQTVTWQDADGLVGNEQARWLVDASGVAALLARKNGWLKSNTEHPIASIWSRWSGVKNWDSRELADKFPAWAGRTKGIRHTATNHLVGRGWWAWFIPLKGGDVSIGVVFDQRLVDLPAGERLGPRLRAMLMEHPAAHELLADATWHEDDVHFRRNLAYRSTTFAGNGFVLVGDAAAFLDPFYSPGLDWISYTTSAASALIAGSLRGRAKAPRIARHNEQFSNSYDRWFRAIYKDKYFYMGDHELMNIAFRLDFGLYYAGVVWLPFKYGQRALETPAFGGLHARRPARLIAFYNRRLVTIAQSRWQRGTWGRRNTGQYFGFRSYELTRALPWRLLKAFCAYLRLEMREGWRTWLKAPVLPKNNPASDTSPLQPEIARANTAPVGL